MKNYLNDDQMIKNNPSLISFIPLDLNKVWFYFIRLYIALYCSHELTNDWSILANIMRCFDASGVDRLKLSLVTSMTSSRWKHTLDTLIRENTTILSLVEVIHLLIVIEQLQAVIHLRTNWLFCRKDTSNDVYDRLATQTSVCVSLV